MKLRDYLNLNGIPMTAFGAAIGRSHTVVSRLCSGKSSPSMSLMATIERVTNGKVEARDFYPPSGHDDDPSGKFEHGASPEHRDESGASVPKADFQSSRSSSGDLLAKREHADDSLQDFASIEPPTLKQAVFETGLREAIDQPTFEGKLAALDQLERQVKRRVA